MPIVIESRRRKLEILQSNYVDAHIIDVTSKAEMPWVKFSPFYPHGDIPVPFTPDQMAQSVEGIWQGLKVFETEDVDTQRFEITTMKGLKRTVRKYGMVSGHRNGVNGDTLLSYREARYLIYLPIYRFVLDNHLQDEIAQLRARTQSGTLVLLDYETNTDIDNLAKPLSHAGLIKHYLDNTWPQVPQEIDV